MKYDNLIVEFCKKEFIAVSEQTELHKNNMMPTDVFDHFLVKYFEFKEATSYSPHPTKFNNYIRRGKRSTSEPGFTFLIFDIYINLDDLS